MDPVEAKLLEELEAHDMIRNQIKTLREKLLEPLPHIRKSIEEGLS